MPRPTRCIRTGSHPLPRGWLPRLARRTTSAAPRRALTPLVTAAAVVAGSLAAAWTSPVLAAGWANSASRASGTLTMATVADSSWSKVAGAGTVNGASYSISGLLNGTNTGYVDLVNNATVSATLTLTMTMNNVGAATPASVCSQPWNTGTGACPGTTTVIGTTVLLGAATPGYTTPARIPAGGHVYLQVTANGVAAQVTLTRSAVTPRPAADRTSS